MDEEQTPSKIAKFTDILTDEEISYIQVRTHDILSSKFYVLYTFDSVIVVLMQLNSQELGIYETEERFLLILKYV